MNKIFDKHTLKVLYIYFLSFVYCVAIPVFIYFLIELLFSYLNSRPFNDKGVADFGSGAFCTFLILSVGVITLLQNLSIKFDDNNSHTMHFSNQLMSTNIVMTKLLMQSVMDKMSSVRDIKSISIKNIENETVFEVSDSYGRHLISLKDMDKQGFTDAVDQAILEWRNDEECGDNYIDDDLDEGNCQV